MAMLMAGVPAAFGLTGNASFSRDVPVRTGAGHRLEQLREQPVGLGELG